MRELIEQLRAARLAVYKVEPDRINEDHGIEQTVLSGGYGYRQVLELVQPQGTANPTVSTAENRFLPWSPLRLYIRFVPTPECPPPTVHHL